MAVASFGTFLTQIGVFHFSPSVSFRTLKSRHHERLCRVSEPSFPCRLVKTDVLRVSYSCSLKRSIQCWCTSDFHEQSQISNSLASSYGRGNISLSIEEPEESGGSDKGPVSQGFPLGLSRRTLLAAFTCDLCGTRSERLINPDAYKRGTVYVQCAGCEVYHKLVDNLGLVVEYDFRAEAVGTLNIDTDAKTSGLGE